MSPVKFVKEGLTSSSEIPVSKITDTSLTQEKIPLNLDLPKMGPPSKFASGGDSISTSCDGMSSKRPRLCSSAKEDDTVKESREESPNNHVKRKSNAKTAWSKSKKIIRCLLCQEKGHGVKDCPKNKLTPCCHKCGATDHFAKVCSIKEDVQTFAVCFVCNQKGHLGKSCPTKCQVQNQVDAAPPAPVAVEKKTESKEKKDRRDYVSGKQLAKRNEVRFKKIREELIASGKSPEEIEREFMGVQRSILKKAFFIRCHLCQERGHGQKDCPKSQGFLVCHKCGQSGHFSKDCAIKGEAHKFAVCFLCRQMGHLGKFCPNNPSERTGPCYVCNETTHLQKDCPLSQNVSSAKEKP